MEASLSLQLVGSLTATLCACLSETDPSAYNALDYASMTGKYDSRYMPFAGSYAYRWVINYAAYWGYVRTVCYC